jgi:hypothetical protein
MISRDVCLFTECSWTGGGVEWSVKVKVFLSVAGEKIMRVGAKINFARYLVNMYRSFSFEWFVVSRFVLDDDEC